MRFRYDDQKKIYRDCRWCKGSGCLYCEAEAAKDYKAEFSDGPVPIATFDMSKPEDVAAAKASIGADAITGAFSQGGGGMAEVMRNLARVGK